jgi:hypothetical protein
VGGQAKIRREQREQAERQRPELESKLKEQFELLNLHASMFDGGHPVVALPLAVEIRVLLHDTGTSHSLCELLGLKSTITLGWGLDL